MTTAATVWSYGGGTQSAAIAALIVAGDLAAPDLAVIADTGREPHTTWDYLKRVVQPALPFPIHIIPHSFTGEGLNTVDLYSGKDRDTLVIPAFSSQSEDGRRGMLRKYCSHEWKTRPVQRFCRQQGIFGADFWIGYSIDELERCRSYDETERWRHVYPLIERRLSRNDCSALVESFGWPAPPRSACWMCPYRSDQEWLHLKQAAPDDFQRAVQLERAIQERDPHAWLHPDRQPLSEVNFNDQPDLFAKPCASGMCFT